MHDTAGHFLPENDAPYTPYCHQKVNRIELDNTLCGRDEYTPINKYYDEIICAPPDENRVMINQVHHQKCELKLLYNYYCFSKEEDVTINYKRARGRSNRLCSKKVKLHTGCECGLLDDRKR